MNQKKEKDETNGYRNTNGKESDDAEEPGKRGSRMSIIGHDGIHLCELHGINVKTYHYHLRRVRESLLTEICVIGLHNIMIDSLWNVSLVFSAHAFAA